LFFYSLTEFFGIFQKSTGILTHKKRDIPVGRGPGPDPSYSAVTDNCDS